MSDDSPKDPVGVPAKAPRSRITNEQARQAAIMFGSGHDEPRICEQLRISRGQLRRLKDKPEWNAQVDEFRGKFNDVMVNHKLRLLELNEDAHGAMRDTLNSDDDKVKLAALKYYREQTGQATPPPSAGLPEGATVTVTQNNVHVEAAKALKEITSTLPDVLTAAVLQDDEKHVRTGDEALPQALLERVSEATKRAEIQDADFIPAGTEDEL